MFSALIWDKIGHSKKVFTAHEKGSFSAKFYIIQGCSDQTVVLQLSVYPRKVEIQIHSICPKSLFQVRLLWPEESDLKNTLILCPEYEAEAIHGFYAVLL